MVESYREVLAQEFSRRVQANASYSLRAFARDIGLQPSSLSLVMNGTRGLSREMARKIASKLKFNKKETEYFCELVVMQCGRSHLLREKARQRVEILRAQKITTLSTDQFHFISDWYHIALTELVKIPNFVADPVWISQKLGISEEEAAQAWKRLCRMKLIYQDSEKRWASNDFTTTTDGVPSQAIRRFHTQVLEKAKKSLQKDPLPERSHTAIFFGIQQEQVSEANELIRQFRRDLENQMAKSRKIQGQEMDRLYCLSVQFFGIDNK